MASKVRLRKAFEEIVKIRYGSDIHNPFLQQSLIEDLIEAVEDNYDKK